MSESVPDSVAQVIGVDRLQALQSNLQSLVGADALTRLRAGIEEASPQGAEIVEQLLALMKSSLSQAIGDIFLISVGVAALAFVATIFMRRSGVEGHNEFRGAPATADGD